MSRVDRFELWTDVQSVGSRLAFVPINDVQQARRVQDVDGTDTVELRMYRDAPSWAHVQERRVLYTLFDDGTEIEHRIDRKTPIRSAEGALLGSIRARSILLDLDDSLMTRSEADGSTHSTYSLLAFTRDELVDLIVAAAPSHFSKGTVDSGSTVVESFTFDVDSPLSALQRLAEVAELELSISGVPGSAYQVNLMEQVGSSATVPEFRYAKNLVAVQRTSDASDMVNKLYAFGANEGGVRANMGDHLFTVDSVSSVDADTSDVVITETDVIAEDDSLNDRGILRKRSGVADVEYLIEDSTRSSNTVRVTDSVGGGAPAIQAGDFIRFLHNPPVSGSAFDGNLLPDADVETTDWTATPLWSKIDDGDTADSADVITTSSTSTSLETKDCEVGLANPGATVDSVSIHRVKVNAKRTDTVAVESTLPIIGSLTAALYQGTTEISSYSFIPSSAYNWVMFDLTSTEIGNISDYTDLRIRLTASMKVINAGDSVQIDVAAAHLKITANPDEDPTGEGLIFVEDPASQTTWGTVVGRSEHNDIREVANLVANPAVRNWTSGVPDNWNLVGVANFSQITDERYTRYGGSSARFNTNSADVGLKTDDITIFPTSDSPFFSAYIIIWNESADGLRFYVEWDDGTDTFQSPAVPASEQNQWIMLEIAGIEVSTTATAMRLFILAESTASTPWYLDAAQLTQTGSNVDFIDGRSGNILWQRAVRELRKNSQPAVAYEIQAKDLTAVDSANFPHDALTIGGNLKIVDRDLSVSETLRLMRLRRDLLTGADIDLDVETFGEV